MTRAELLQQAYTGPSAQAQGMTGEDFRAQMQEHGERVRWWRAYKADEGVTWAGLQGPNGELPNSQGTLFIEQDLDEAVRVQLYSNQQEVVDESFGLIRIGTTMISCMPDEIELARGDRILTLDRSKLDREAIEQDSTLRHQFPASIERITSVQDGVLDASTYSLNGRNILWAGTPPDGVLLIDYRYYPVYEFGERVNRQGPLGTDNVRLPQHGSLQLIPVEHEAM